MQAQRSTSPGWLWLLALFGVALALPLPFLGQTPLSFVEILTAEAISLPVRGLIEHRLQGAHTPTWYLLLKFAGLAGGEPWLLRLPSALAQAATALLAGLVGWRIAGPRGFLACGLLVALQPILLEFANYARPYAALMGTSLWLLLSAAALADRPRLALAALRRGGLPRGLRWRLRRRWISALLAPLVTASLLPLGLLIWAALDLTLLGWLWWRPGRGRVARRRLLKPFVLWRLLPVLATALGYLALYNAFSRFAGNYWPREFSATAVFQVLQISHGWLPLVDRDLYLPLAGDWVLGLLMGGLALLGFCTARRRAARVLAAALVLGLPLLLFVISLHTSLLVPRYFAPASAGLALLAGAGVAWLASRLPARGFAALAFLLFSLSGLQALDALSGDRKRPRIEVLAGWMLEAHPGAGEEALVTNFEATPFALNYYLDLAGSDLRSVAVDFETARVLLDKGRRIWVVAVYSQTYPAWVTELVGERPVTTCERRIGNLVTVTVVSLERSAWPPICERPVPP